VTPNQLTQQLAALKSRLRWVLYLGLSLLLLFEMLIVIHFFEAERAQPKSRSTLHLGLVTLGLCLVLWALFLVILRRMTVKLAPSCPHCAKPITWRERNAALQSGRCPRCKNVLFDAS
jgi:hypothetical protein